MFNLPIFCFNVLPLWCNRFKVCCLVLLLMTTGQTRMSNLSNLSYFWTTRDSPGKKTNKWTKLYFPEVRGSTPLPKMSDLPLLLIFINRFVGGVDFNLPVDHPGCKLQHCEQLSTKCSYPTVARSQSKLDPPSCLDQRFQEVPCFQGESNTPTTSSR